MSRLSTTSIRHAITRIAVIAATATLAVFATRLVGPGVTQAQPSEIRATAFVLVGPDGAVLGRLAPGTPAGNGVLTLYDAAGRRRLLMGGGGVVSIFDTDDKARVQLAFNPAAGGLLLFNDADEALRFGLSSNANTGNSGLGINDANRRPRIQLGTFDGEMFGLIVRDAEGNIIGTAAPR